MLVWLTDSLLCLMQRELRLAAARTTQASPGKTKVPLRLDRPLQPFCRTVCCRQHMSIASMAAWSRSPAPPVARAQHMSLIDTGCVQDWRCVRAQLLAQEVAASRAITLQPLWAPDLLWAHRLGTIEHGCLLISRQEDNDCFSGSVVLVTWHGTRSVCHASTCIALPRTPAYKPHES